MQKTTKTRLREEFNSGDTLDKICARLNADGFGRQLKSGEWRVWTAPELSAHFIRMGLRRTLAYSKSTKVAPAQTRQKNKSAGQVLASVRSLLGIETMDPDERITLAVMAIEGAGYAD